MGARRDVVILGATGSIGTQALDVIGRNRDAFRVVGLSAGGGKGELLGQQAAEFGVCRIAVADEAAADAVLASWRTAAAPGDSEPELLLGSEAATELAGTHVHTVLNGMTGSIGLLPTLAALDAGNTLALANKESLIVGGPIVLAAAAEGQIVPVDSEHSALVQCLRGGRSSEVRRLILTASGGPFRGRSAEALAGATVAEALAHPTWNMGPVVTINSATLMNKGLEVIEAHFLFGLDFDRIDVVVHPQSVIHSMVEFIDGSTLAQASPPDMRLPIALALGWPTRVPAAASACDWSRPANWTFEPLDTKAFPAVDLARRVGAAGGCAPAVLNAANEECVLAFLGGNLKFPAVVSIVSDVVREHLARPAAGNVLSVADVLSAEMWARSRANELIGGRA
jgi:1-deoxy-D-xylulose-5-phosphate reductoisomerase